MSQLYLPFDTETGGLDCRTTDVLTFYMAVMDENFQILDEVDMKLKPDDGRKVNGINVANHMANPETITYSEAKIKLLTMLKKHLKKTGRYSNLIPMGHNVPFDIGYTQQYILPKEEWEKILHYRTIDTNPIVGFFKDCGWFPREIGNLVALMSSKKENQGSAQQDLIALLEAE